MPRLAVIMPVRNGEETLLRAVTSTLRALPRDACLLILDDASTDRTRQYVEQVDDPRIRLIASPYRLGVHGALNRLLDEVDAELVARMDADDICLPWRFRAELHALGRDTDVVFSPVVEFRTRPRRLAVQPPVGIPPEAMRLHMILANPVVHSTMLGRTEHLRRVGGYRALHAEDYDLWMRMCTRGSRLRRIALPTLLYRAHAGQVTASASWRGRALGEQQLRESYAELSTAVLGRSPAWWSGLRRLEGAPAADPDDCDGGDDRALAELSRSLRDHSHALRPKDRAFFTAKQDKVLGGIS